MAVVSTNEIIVGYKVVGQAELQRLAASLNSVSEADQRVLAEMRTMNTQMKTNASTASTTSKETVKGIKDVENETNKLSGSLKGIGGLIAGAFAAGSIIAFGKELLRTTANYEQFRKSIDFATGSQSKGAQSFQFLIEAAKKYGLSLEALTEGYKNFSASSKLAGTSLSEINRQYLAIAKASATLGLSSDRTKLVLNGLSQIASKGVVSMEELRQQIGDSLPGALNIAAKSMNMTTQAFIKFVSEGKLLSSEFLPRFATELEKAFGADAGKNIDTITGKINNLSTSFDLLKVAIGSAIFDNDGQFANFGRGLQIVIDKMVELFGSDKFKREQESYKTITSVVAQYGKASNQVIQDEINERGVLIRQLEKEGYRRKKDAEDFISLNGEMTAIQKGLFEAMANYTLDEINKNNDVRKGLNQILKERKANEVAIVKTTEQLQKEYDIALKRLELEKQILILTKINNNIPPDLATAQSEVVFQKKKLGLQKQGVSDGLKVTQQEVELTIQEKEKAATELIKVEEHQNIKTRDGVESLHKQVAAIEKQYAEEFDSAKKQRLKDEFDMLEAERKEKERIEKLKLHYQTEAIRQATNLAINITNGLFAIQQANLENDLVKTKNYYSEQIRLAEGNAQRQAEIKVRQEQAEKEIRTKQFKAQQNQAIANAVFQAAPYIIEYTAELPITAANLALTVGSLAAQIAIIKSQPVPEFFKGVENFQGGFAKVGERGSELIETPKGTFLSPDSTTVTYLPKGTNVITAPKTRERLQMMNSTYRKGQDQFQVIDTSPIAAELSRMPVGTTVFDARGFTEYVREGNRTTQILNRRKGL